MGSGRLFSLPVMLGAMLWAAPLPAAQAQEPAPNDAAFPRFSGLESNVEFWRRAFAEWSVTQVVIHDLDYPAVIYEVADLDGPREFPYTDAQRDYVEDLRESWEDRLKTLEGKIMLGWELTDEDKALALQITTNAGTDAIRGAHERVRSQRGLREQFARGVEVSGKYLDRFRAIFREAGLPEDLAYLPHVESSFQEFARSSAGAAGMWQFTRGTGRNYLTITSAVDERLDPVAAAYGAARYLKDAHDVLGTWPLALTSYNHGVQGMTRAKSQFGTDFERIVQEYDSRSFGFASRNFYAEFLAARDVARSHERYFPEGLAILPPLSLDETSLAQKTTPGAVARRYGVSVDELALLNPAWTSAAVRSGYSLPAGTRVWLPRGSLAAAVATPAPATEPAAEGSVHVVRRGETLSMIATRYGTTISELRSLNGIPSRSSLIQVGQTLRVAPAAAADAMSEPQAPPESAAASEPQAETLTHVVKRGESMTTIAARYSMTVAELRMLNGMSAGHSLILAGQRLVVRASEGVSAVHVVERGDTLTDIATVYGVQLADLLAANRLSARAVIRPGQQIQIPSGR
jgi:membrane-bound lytic murein transglycosylase D